LPPIVASRMFSERYVNAFFSIPLRIEYHNSLPGIHSRKLSQTDRFRRYCDDVLSSDRRMCQSPQISVWAPFSSFRVSFASPVVGPIVPDSLYQGLFPQLDRRWPIKVSDHFDNILCQTRWRVIEARMDDLNFFTLFRGNMYLRSWKAQKDSLLFGVNTRSQSLNWAIGLRGHSNFQIHRQTLHRIQRWHSMSSVSWIYQYRAVMSEVSPGYISPKLPGDGLSENRPALHHNCSFQMSNCPFFLRHHTHVRFCEQRQIHPQYRGLF
jgi:hypothetical protein